MYVHIYIYCNIYPHAPCRAFQGYSLALTIFAQPFELNRTDTKSTTDTFFTFARKTILVADLLSASGCGYQRALMVMTVTGMGNKDSW